MGRKRSPKNSGLPPNLYIRNGGYYSYRDPETRVEYGLGRDRRDAINQAIETNLQLMPTNLPVKLIDRITNKSEMTFHQWLDKYILILNGRKLKQTSLSDYSNRIKAIRTAFNDISISQITTKDIAQFLSIYVQQGKATRAKLLRSTLKDIFREAIADGHIQNNVVEVTRPPKTEVQRSRLSLSDFHAILERSDCSPPFLRLGMELALVIGQRVSDIRNLSWDDVHDGKLWVEQQKTGARLALPLELQIQGFTLSDILNRCKQASPHSKTVLASTAGNSLSDGVISGQFAKARAKTGLIWEGTPPSFHEIRSLAARLYTEVKGEQFAQHLLGHKSAEMTAKYRDERSNGWAELEI